MMSKWAEEWDTYCCVTGLRRWWRSGYFLGLSWCISAVISEALEAMNMDDITKTDSGSLHMTVNVSPTGRNTRAASLWKLAYLALGGSLIVGPMMIWPFSVIIGTLGNAIFVECRARKVWLVVLIPTSLAGRDVFISVHATRGHDWRDIHHLSHRGEIWPKSANLCVQ
ncbi:hypothetical protein B0T21DRAFT_43764 [Apiosordaria backusii]|uniref:Uncharacterized protein n=1 Tax=Apiosordaria backusii TaxID=314023 RepID=A0AA40E0W2_9PEZI|nr:hypothetical protein B0T21DRAFT_43764 [Apiosordaria backusii]